MQTNFGGRDLSSFIDLIPFRLPSKTTMVIKKFNRSESAQKIHASKD